MRTRQIFFVSQATSPTGWRRPRSRRGEAVLALWQAQFRLKTPNVVTNIGTAALPYQRALAAAEQAALVDATNPTVAAVLAAQAAAAEH